MFENIVEHIDISLHSYNIFWPNKSEREGMGKIETIASHGSVEINNI